MSQEATTVLRDFSPSVNLRAQDIERFWGKVDRSAGPSGCWIWTGGKFNHGYGRFWAAGKSIQAHRASWLLHNGGIPHDGSFHGICVCHHCDVPACVNPNHLFLGTVNDNNQDRVNKGRSARGALSGASLHPERMARGDRNGSRTHPECRAYGARNGRNTKPERSPRGERHGRSKLTESQVREIRMRYANGGVTQQRLADEFGVYQTKISAAIRHQTWAHVASSANI